MKPNRNSTFYQVATRAKFNYKLDIYSKNTKINNNKDLQFLHKCYYLNELSELVLFLM